MISIIALSLAALSPGAAVTGLSVMPVADRTEVVIEFSGTVTANDFALNEPARLVLDISGMGDVSALQHRIERGGIKSLRLSQFEPGIVRLVIDLVKPVDYRIIRGNSALRVSFENTAGAFDPWTSAPAAPQTAKTTAPPAGTLPSAARAAQQRPPISVTFSDEPVSNVLAAFADFAGRSIIASSEVKTQQITAEVRNQPWDVALEAVLAANNLVARELESGVILVQDGARVVQRQTEEPLVSRQYPIVYVCADSLVETVRAMLSPQ
jgi:hypothetical protein